MSNLVDADQMQQITENFSKQQEEVARLQSENESYKARIDDLNTGNSSLKAKIDQLEQDINALTTERDSARQTNQREKKTIEFLNSAQKTLQDAKGKADQELEHLRLLLNKSAMSSECHTRFKSSAEKIQRAYRQRQRKLQERRAKAEIIKRADRHLLRKKITTIQRLWRARQERLRQRLEVSEKSRTSPQGLTRYDVVLTFTSLSDFVSSGKVELVQAAQSAFNIAEEQRYRIVAVVGLFDKGKTYMINKMLGTDLPSGKLFTTEGMSFLWVKKRRMLILDSQGVQATVSMKKAAVEPILDAQTTESLLFEMISRLAHNVIFVVNDFTWIEQKFIMMLHQKYVLKKDAKELIVFHNLRTTGTIPEARKLFKNQITSCYEGEMSHLGELMYHADKGPGQPPVHHLGVCQHGTIAGEYYNERNFKNLLDMVEHANCLGSTMALSKQIADEFGQLLPKFVTVEDLNGTPCAEVSQQCTVDYVARSPSQDGPADSGEYILAGALEMQTECPESRVVMKTQGVIDSLGNVIEYNRSFCPHYNVFDNKEGTLREIQIECSGVKKESCDVQKLPNGVRIVMEKPRAIDDTQMKAIPNYPIRQQQGIWEQDFNFSHEEGYFTILEEELTLEHGVLTVLLRRSNEIRKLKFGKKKAAS